MDEFQRGYERERGAASYRAKASCLGCLVGLALVAAVLAALVVLSAFLTFMALPASSP
jgi:hypothetical protein